MSKMSRFTKTSPDPPDMLVKTEIKEEHKCDDILQQDLIMVQEVDIKPGLEHSCKLEVNPAKQGWESRTGDRIEPSIK